MKRHLDELAVFGGTPVFERPLHVGQPAIPPKQDVLNRLETVLDSGWLTNNGPVVQQFEAEVCRIADVRHCVAVCNGTMALQLIAKACGLTGEVIVPSMTFIATAHALEWIGLTPVFADIRLDDHTIDVESVRRCITPRTSAILGVHLWGNPCDVTALQQLADEHDLELLFDASHAFGCRRNGQPVGGFGRGETFSFHATKVVHSVEGGAVVTNCDDTAERLRTMRNFGITGFTSIGSAGTNGKLNELSAAVGLASLGCLPDRIRRNREIQQAYRFGMFESPGIQMVDGTADSGGNGQYAVCTVDDAQLGLTRDQLLQVLRADDVAAVEVAEGILARSYFMPGCHESSPYAGSIVHRPVSLTATQRVLETVMQCPVGDSVTPVAVATICEFTRWIAEHAHGIRTLLESARPSFNHTDDPVGVTHVLSRAG